MKLSAPLFVVPSRRPATAHWQHMRWFVITCLLAAAVNAAASAVTVRLDGEPVSNGRLCFHRSLPGDDPAAQLLGGANVTCADATRPVELAAGDWLAFARLGDEYASIARTRFDATKQQLDTHVIDVHKVAAIDTPTRKNARYVVYVPSTGGALPVIGDVALVPLEDSAYVVEIVSGHIVRVAGPISGREMKELPAWQPAVGVAVHFDRDRLEESEGRLPAPPSLYLRGDAERAALWNLRSASPGATSLVLFSISDEVHEVVVRGEGWKTVAAPLRTDDGARFLSEPIAVVPTSEVTIRWMLDRPLDSQPTSSRSACGDGHESDEKTTSELVLLRCDKGGTGEEDVRLMVQRGCDEVARHAMPLDQVFGEAAFTGVDTGLYLVRLASPGLPPLYKPLRVTAAQQTESLAFRYFSFFGAVERGGEPVHAELNFIGERVVTDPHTGRYDAVLPRDPGLSVLFVTPCEEGSVYRYVPDTSPVEHTRYDIRMPENHVEISVVEGSTNRALAGATITLTARSADDPEDVSFVGQVGLTDANGHLEITNLSPNRELLVCASQKGFEQACAEPFTIDEDGEHSVLIALLSNDSRKGRVVVAGTVHLGFVHWYSESGRLLDQAVVRADGSFTYTLKEAAGTIVVFISRSHPLFVFRQPPLFDDDELLITPPLAPIRDFDVLLSRDSRYASGYFSIQVGALRVPLNAFGLHQSMRAGTMSIERGSRAGVLDVLATGPVAVVFVPESVMQGPGNRDEDVVLRPEARGLAVFPVPASGLVSLNP